jgi:hypothetical protein
MVPVNVRDDEIRDLVRFDARASHGLARDHESGGMPPLDEIVAMEPGIDENPAAIGAFEQPDHHGDVQPPTRVRAGDEAGCAERRNRRVPNRIHLVGRRGSFRSNSSNGD